MKSSMQKRPNIVFVFGDQHRAQAMGYSGDPNLQTPNFDRLSSMSVNFKNAVSVQPVCTPFRAALLTGKYPLTNGVFLNDLYLPENRTSIAYTLNQNGYDTAYIGKWHLDGKGRSTFVPPERRQGFKYWRGMECTHDYMNSPYYGDTEHLQKWLGYDAFAQTECAKEYILNKDGKQPFALFLSWGPPHSPYSEVPREYADKFKPEDIILRPNIPVSQQERARRELAGYYAHISALDNAIGEITKCLSIKGFIKDTIFIYTSDHGDMIGSQGEFGKQRPWDESITVPFLLRYPALLGENSIVVDYPINTPDIYPTLMGLCGLETPAEVEGFDYSKLLTGEEDYPKEALIMQPCPFGEYTREQGGREFRGIRTDKYTYVRDLTGPWLLYDNQTDPYQNHNLCGITKYSEAQTELDNRLNNLLKKRGDSFLPGDKYIEKYNYIIKPGRVYTSIAEMVEDDK